MKNREWLRRLPMDLLMDIVGGSELLCEPQ